LGDGEFAARPRNKRLVARHVGGDPKRVDNRPTGALDLAAHRIPKRLHRHLEPGQRSAAGDIEKPQEVDMLRPEIAGALAFDVLAGIFPGCDRRERGRLARGAWPQIEVDRRPGRTPRDAAEGDWTGWRAEIGAIGEEMRMGVDIGAR